jgi:hypothetical protein
MANEQIGPCLTGIFTSSLFGVVDWKMAGVGAVRKTKGSIWREETDKDGGRYEPASWEGRSRVRFASKYPL